MHAGFTRTRLDFLRARIGRRVRCCPASQLPRSCTAAVLLALLMLQMQVGLRARREIFQGGTTHLVTSRRTLICSMTSAGLLEAESAVAGPGFRR